MPINQKYSFVNYIRLERRIQFFSKYFATSLLYGKLLQAGQCLIWYIHFIAFTFAMNLVFGVDPKLKGKPV